MLANQIKGYFPEGEKRQPEIRLRFAGYSGPDKRLKQIIQIKHNGDKNPDWQTSRPFTSMVGDLNLGLPNCIQLAVRAGHEAGASELQVQRSNLSATLPPIPQS